MMDEMSCGANDDEYDYYLGPAIIWFKTCCFVLMRCGSDLITGGEGIIRQCMGLVSALHCEEFGKLLIL